MLHEKEAKIIVDNLENRLKTLKSCKKNRVSQIAVLGSDLKILLDEINDIESVLDKLVEKDDDEE